MESERGNGNAKRRSRDKVAPAVPFEFVDEPEVLPDEFLVALVDLLLDAVDRDQSDAASKARQ